MNALKAQKGRTWAVLVTSWSVFLACITAGRDWRTCSCSKTALQLRWAEAL
jgi:hypothetical protein